jgi:integrase
MPGDEGHDGQRRGGARPARQTAQVVPVGTTPTHLPLSLSLSLLSSPPARQAEPAARRIPAGARRRRGRNRGQDEGRSPHGPYRLELRRHLAAHKLRSGRDDDALVFGAAPSVPFTPTTVRSRALAAWKAAKLMPIGLHEGRHTFASLMIAAGVNAKALSTYMGHASVTITYDRTGT